MRSGKGGKSIAQLIAQVIGRKYVDSSGLAIVLQLPMSLKCSCQYHHLLPDRHCILMIHRLRACRRQWATWAGEVEEEAEAEEEEAGEGAFQEPE